MRRRSKRPLPIPQWEFGFSPETFNLIQETTLDGERITRERAEAEEARRIADAAQVNLFTAKSSPSVKLPDAGFPFRLRAGDLVRYAGQDCRVLRVSECAAVIAITKEPREFTTLFGVRVRIQPKPGLVRISSNSEIPILNR